jgi:hypothetical protein
MKLFQNRKIKGICLIGLRFIMLIPMMLTGCETTTEPPVYDTRLNFLTNSGMSIYRVVYPMEDCPNTVRSAAEELQAVMQEVLGVDVAITDDKGTVNATDQFQPYEILIGKTARAATQKVLPELDGEEFVVRVDGHKIVIAGASNRATYAGVRHFIENVVRQGTVEDGKPVVKIATDYEYQGKYTSPKQPAVAGNTTLPVAPYRPVVLYTVAQPTQVADQLALATLQGLSMTYSSEQVFIVHEGTEAQLSALVEQGAIAIGHNDAEQTWTLGRLLNYYSNRLSGYILCSMDTTSESAEVAINLAHYLNAVVVTPENEEVAQAAGLSLVADVTDKDDAWLRATPYFEKMSKTLAVEPDIAQSVAFVDYVVMSGCYYHDYREGDEYMHVQSFKHLDTGAYLLTLPGDDEHHTITFEAIGLVVLTPDQTLWANLSLLMAADPVKVEEALATKK